jgi:hypothetical protein
MLACGPTAGDGVVNVVISSPADGDTALAGQEVMIDSVITAAAGVDRVDLTVDGQVVRHDTPPEENPTEFRVSQLWMPASEGQATITVVAYDVNGASDEASITLQVAASGAAVPPQPTETPVPPVTTEAGCTLGSQYVADVTIPDGTMMSPGEMFVKTWRVRNSGTCDWESGYELVFVSGEQMGGPASVKLSVVAAGAETDVSVNLTAPGSYGTHKGAWRVRSGEGTMFGTNLTVEIEVVSSATETPPPTSAPTAVPTVAPPKPTVVPINPLPSISPYTERVTEETTLDGGGEASITADCPAGSVVVGGGYSGSPDVVIPVQTKSGNGWRVYAANTALSDKTVRVYAVCLRNMVGTSVSVEQQEITVGANGDASAIVHCPAGSVVTGAGWETEYVDVRVQASGPLDPGWLVRAHNESSSDHPLYVYAVCLSGSGGIVTGFSETVSIPGGSSGSVAVACPPHSLMTSGGFAGLQGLEVFINSGPWGAGPEGEWRVYGANTSGSDLELQAYAACMGFP